MVISCGTNERFTLSRSLSLKSLRWMCALVVVAGLQISGGQHAFGLVQTDDRRLVADVDMLNEIVGRYKRAGGWFSERDNAQRVMVRLAIAQGDFGITLLGRNSGHRMVPVIANRAPERAKWAYWNVGSKRFQVWRGVAPYKVQIVTRFERRQDAAPLTAKDFAHRTSGIRKAVPPGQVAGHPVKAITKTGHVSGGLKAATPQAGAVTLLPPGFDPPAGKFSVSAFETLSIHLQDPNPAGERKMHYCIDGSLWREYSGTPITVMPGSELLAYCGSTNLDRWRDSEPVAARYVLASLKIELALSVSARQLPAHALVVGKGQDVLFPVVTIANIETVPGSVRCKEFFEVVWTIDGSDPLRSETAFPAIFKDGYGRGARLPLSVLSGKSPGKLRIRAAARSTDRHLLLDSREAAIDLEIVR